MTFELLEIYGFPIVVDEGIKELRMPKSLIEFLSKCCEKDVEGDKKKSPISIFNIGFGADDFDD